MCPRVDCTKKPMAAYGGVFAGRWWCVMNAVDWIRVVGSRPGTAVHAGTVGLVGGI